MLAQNDTLVTTVFPHPRWCTEQHVNAGPGLHQSADIVIGHLGETAVTVQRVRMDAEPGFPQQRDEIWLSVGHELVERTVTDAAGLPQQLRSIAASLELILGGA